jgi:molybdopterin converting factor subunit 1
VIGAAAKFEFAEGRRTIKTAEDDDKQGYTSINWTDNQGFKVLYFASAKDATGLSSEEILIPETSESQSISIADLFELLETRHPKLKQKKILASVAVAVNLEYVEIEEGVVKAGDEVAIIPPVSGG